MSDTKQLAVCPRCNDMHGWYEKRQQSYQQYFDASSNATHAADGGGNGRGGKRKYCSECGKDITDRIGEESP